MKEFRGARRWVGLLIVALLNIAGSVAQAQRLPPAIAAAANPITDGQALVKQGKFTEALAKFGEAQGAAAAVPQSVLRLFYQVTARLGSATALDGLNLYDAALEHADWANETMDSAQARQLPDTLRAAVHHMRGVILYHLKRNGDATAMFGRAVKEGDKTAADWQKVINAPAVSTKPADIVAQADIEAQRGKLDEALLLYVIALQQFDELGDKAPPVMEKALGVALRLDPPPPIPNGAGDRLQLVETALRSGAPDDLQAARDLLHLSLIEVPWWGDGWKRLADVEEKLGNLAAARGALRFYLKAASRAPDRDAVEQRVASLGQKIEAGGSSTGPTLSAAAESSAGPAAALAAPPDISGNWSTVDGRIIAVKQNGNQVSWSSCCKPGHEDLVVTVTGTFDGRTLTGTYRYRENQAAGTGAATYTLNGDRLEGTWKAPDGKTWTSALIRHAGEAPSELGGKWTTVSGHTVTLAQNVKEVSWTTCCRQSHPNWVADISALFDGKNLVGTYHWRDGGQQGNGTVNYVLNGNQLEGTLERPGKEPYHSVLTRQADADLSGKWTTQSGATLTLTQKGNDVTGTECCRPERPDWSGDVSGSFDGKNFVGVFRFREGNAQGMGTFIYALNDGQFEGSFKSAGGSEVKSVLTRQPTGGAANPAPNPAPLAAAMPGPQAVCHTDPLNIDRMADNPTVSVKQRSIGGAACTLNFITGSPGSASVTANPAHGSITQAEALKLKYQAADGFKGSDRYSVKLCDQAGCANITYNIAVE